MIRCERIEGAVVAVDRGELERLRLLVGGAPVARAPVPVGGASRFVGKVVSPQSALAVGSFMLVQPADVFFAESEGVTGQFTAQPLSVPVLLLGPRVPNTGDFLVCSREGSRWVSDRRGHVVQTVAMSCGCPQTPAVLFLTSNDPAKNFGQFPNLTLTYGPKPADLATLALPSNAWYSPPYYSPDSGGRLVRHYLVFACFNVFQPGLALVYPDGNPPNFSGPVYVWTVGQRGCTCSPFNFPGGGFQPGYDNTQVLSLAP